MKYLKRFFTLVLASTLFTTPVMATENDNSEAAFESQTNEAEKDNNLIPEVEEQTNSTVSYSVEDGITITLCTTNGYFSNNTQQTIMTFRDGNSILDRLEIPTGYDSNLKFDHWELNGLIATEEMLNADSTLYAVFVDVSKDEVINKLSDEELVTITFDCGEGTTSLSTIEVQKGSQVYINDYIYNINPPQGKGIKGYTVDCAEDPTHVYTLDSYNSFIIDESTTIHIVYGIMYQVTLDSNGMNLDSVSYDLVESSSYYVTPSSFGTIAGYRIEAWAIGSPNGSRISNYSNITINNDVTLYAIWTKANTVYLKVDDTLCPYETKKNLEEVYLPFEDCYVDMYGGNVPEGKVLSGWKIDGTDTIVQCGSFLTVIDDIVLVPVWDDPITITLNLGTYGEKTFASTPGEYFYIDNYSLDLPQNVVVLNWKNSEGKIVNNNSIYTENTILYATLAEKTIHLIFDYGDINAVDNYLIESEDVVPGKQYNLNNWSQVSNSNLHKRIIGWKLNDSDDVIGINYVTTFEEDTTLHAVWDDAVMAKFELCDVTKQEYNLDQVTYKGSDVYLPSLTLEDKNKTVVGWHIGSPDGELLDTMIRIPIYEDTTFYAEWSDTYTVTFHATDYLSYSIQNAQYRTLYGFEMFMKNPGYYGVDLDDTRNFKEWRIGGINGEVLTKDTVITSDIDVYAIYEGESPLITVNYNDQQIVVPTDSGFINVLSLLNILNNEITIPEDKIFYGFTDNQDNYIFISNSFNNNSILKIYKDTTLNLETRETVKIRLHQIDGESINEISVPKNLDFSVGFEGYVNDDSNNIEFHLFSEKGDIIYSNQTMNINEDIDIYCVPILNENLVPFMVYQEDLTNAIGAGMGWVAGVNSGISYYHSGKGTLNESITLSLDESLIPKGKQFKEWTTLGNAQIKDKESENTTFVCLENYGDTVIVYPIFEDKPKFEAGLVNDDNGLRYMDSEGEYVKSNEVVVDDDIYYFDENGYAVKNQWQHILGGKGAAVLDIYRYFGPDYKAVKNQWVDGCYLNEYGIRAENQIIGEYYVGSDGKYVKSKWVEIEGSYYYFDSNGKMVKDQWVGNYYLLSTGIMATNQWIGNYYVGADGAWIPNAPVTKWVKEGNNWKYLNTKTNTYSTSKWEKINNVWYYFNEESIMVTGLNTIEGKKYYFNSTGAMKTGWIKTDNQWYYFASNGAAVKGWLKLNNVWYYFNEESIMVTGLNTIEGKKYYFDSTGAMKTGWIKTDNQWYYFASNGAAIKGWLKINNVWYYFNEESNMVTGLNTIEGKDYYFNTSGAMVTGWGKLNNKWYYFQASGAMAKSQWIQDYYLKENGEMATSEIVGMYYVDSTGAYVKNKWVLIGEDYYYFDGSGKMVKNKWIGDYYLGSDGKMARDTWIGVYYVDENGKWIPGKK